MAEFVPIKEIRSLGPLRTEADLRIAVEEMRRRLNEIIVDYNKWRKSNS